MATGAAALKPCRRSKAGEKVDSACRAARFSGLRGAVTRDGPSGCVVAEGAECADVQGAGLGGLERAFESEGSGNAELGGPLPALCSPAHFPHTPLPNPSERWTPRTPGLAATSDLLEI